MEDENNEIEEIEEMEEIEGLEIIDIDYLATQIPDLENAQYFFQIPKNIQKKLDLEERLTGKEICLILQANRKPEKVSKTEKMFYPENEEIARKNKNQIKDAKELPVGQFDVTNGKIKALKYLSKIGLMYNKKTGDPIGNRYKLLSFSIL